MKGNKKSFKTKAFVSFAILWAFIILALSGMVLYISPSGSIARETNWNLIALSRDSWRGIHVIFCSIFIIFVLIHIFFNWKVLISYLKNKISDGIHCKKELIFSLILIVIILFFAIAHFPPFWNLFKLRDKIKYRERTIKKSFLIMDKKIKKDYNLTLLERRSGYEIESTS